MKYFEYWVHNDKPIFEWVECLKIDMEKRSKNIKCKCKNAKWRIPCDISKNMETQNIFAEKWITIQKMRKVKGANNGKNREKTKCITIDNTWFRSETTFQNQINVMKRLKLKTRKNVKILDRDKRTKSLWTGEIEKKWVQVKNFKRAKTSKKRCVINLKLITVRNDVEQRIFRTFTAKANTDTTNAQKRKSNTKKAKWSHAKTNFTPHFCE